MKPLDPRIELMERLYADPEARRAIEEHCRRLFPKANIPPAPHPDDGELERMWRMPS